MRNFLISISIFKKLHIKSIYKMHNRRNLYKKITCICTKIDLPPKKVNKNIMTWNIILLLFATMKK